MSNYPTGLTAAEVQAKHAANLSNKRLDAASPSVPWIIFRNLFNLINVFLFPLMLLLGYFDKWQIVFVMSTFAVINSLVSMYDELSIKRRLDKIQLQSAQRVRVIRDGEEQDILATELVIDDVVKLREGEGVPTDGKIIIANNLQVDESLLTGESNYIAKDEEEGLLGGSFIVTGECIYKVNAVGKQSYINKLAFQSKQFRKEKSQLQQVGDKLTVFFVVAALIFGVAEYMSALKLGQPASEAVVPLTSVVALTIPQTLIFLFTFTFSISVLKLSKLGVLVQRSSSVESLVKLDVLCFDKTGTLTSGDMKVVETKFWNVDEADIAKGFNFLTDKAYGRNKTFETVAGYFHSKDPGTLDVSSFSQVPFTSKTKMARNLFRFSDDTWMQFAYGAPAMCAKFMEPELRDQVLADVRKHELEGRRVIVGVVNKSSEEQDIAADFIVDKVWLIALKEELNEGIATTLKEFGELGTELKVISGDSMAAVERIVKDIGVNLGKAVDLASFEGKLEDIVFDYSIFARAKPEDKLTIINTLQGKGKLVGMVGDGVNDVLALKLSNLSIAMESGAKVAQDVSDMVLMNNDFNLIPKVIFEGQNIISNLKFMNVLFISKTFHAIFLTIMCIIAGVIFPLLPTSSLIYSFMATSLPSYVVAFLRRGTKSTKYFWSEVLPISALGGLIGAIMAIYVQLNNQGLGSEVVGTLVMYSALAFGLLFTITELWRSGYLTKWYHPFAIFLIISSVSFAATLIPLARSYYNLADIGVTAWLTNIIPAFIAFAVYFVFGWLLRKVDFSFLER